MATVVDSNLSKNSSCLFCRTVVSRFCFVTANADSPFTMSMPETAVADLEPSSKLNVSPTIGLKD